jgi:carbonic anhydrase
MACNAPINIIKRLADKCSLKCLLWHKYGNSSCTVRNATDQLIISYDGENDVMFNSISYNPVEVRIFKPSIHKFEGSYADAEIVIVHTGSNGGLLVCIPVNTTTTTAASTGSNLIQDIVASAPAQNESTTLNLTDFNLNYIVPKSSYFSYTGTLPYGECSPDRMYNYVVFPLSSFIVHQSTMDALGDLIHDSYIPVYDGDCYWNETGTKSNGFAGDGQIYIDCQPVGEEGEIIYKEQSAPPSGTKVNLDWIYAFLYILIGAVIMYVGVKLLRLMFMMIPDIKPENNVKE